MARIEDSREELPARRRRLKRGPYTNPRCRLLDKPTSWFYTASMKRTNNPDATRAKILGAAFQEFYRHGFQGASLNRIVKEAGTTKGSVFHHFEGKNALGYAVVDELLSEGINERWFRPLQASTDPVSEIKRIINAEALQFTQDDRMLCQGCPINNLAQEMSPLDQGFRKRVARIYDDWRQSIARALENGIEHGTVRKEVSPQVVAALLVATFAGMTGTVKSAQSPDLLRQIREALFGYLDSLKP
jgi:TetR/AcrR family transcriptional regulator, transcriptional repressor for nem operon